MVSISVFLSSLNFYAVIEKDNVKVSVFSVWVLLLLFFSPLFGSVVVCSSGSSIVQKQRSAPALCASRVVGQATQLAFISSRLET